jgi:transcriptional regulator with XRE-family HTH domain
MDDEDLSKLIRRIQGQRPQLTQSEIARRIGISPSAVNSWVSRKRGTGRGPNRETLSKLAGVLGVSEQEVFTAAGRKTPGHATPDKEQRIIEAFRGLTAEQQQIIEIQMNALLEHNRTTDPA